MSDENIIREFDSIRVAFTLVNKRLTRSCEYVIV